MTNTYLNDLAKVRIHEFHNLKNGFILVVTSQYTGVKGTMILTKYTSENSSNEF